MRTLSELLSKQVRSKIVPDTPELDYTKSNDDLLSELVDTASGLQEVQKIVLSGVAPQAYTLLIYFDSKAMQRRVLSAFGLSEDATSTTIAKYRPSCLKKICDILHRGVVKYAPHVDRLIVTGGKRRGF